MDTSGLMDGWSRYYPPDLFPCVWERIESIIHSGVLIASEEVYHELQKKEGELGAWVHQRRQMFVPMDEAIQAAVSDIMLTHAALVNVNTGGSAADPWVIALAQVRGLTVVSGEIRKPSKVKIPDVCDAKGVRHITLVEMIRELGWRFE
jgi:hypothetical protein